MSSGYWCSHCSIVVVILWPLTQSSSSHSRHYGLHSLLINHCHCQSLAIVSCILVPIKLGLYISKSVSHAIFSFTSLNSKFKVLSNFHLESRKHGCGSRATPPAPTCTDVVCNVVECTSVPCRFFFFFFLVFGFGLISTDMARFWPKRAATMSSSSILLLYVPL